MSRTETGRGDWLYADGWRDRWDAEGSRLLRAALVPDGSRLDATARHLLTLDDLVVEALSELEDRVWLQVGRALVDTGHRRLWAALYALHSRARDMAYHSGDEVRFLARYREVELPERPEGWPWPWLD